MGNTPHDALILIHKICHHAQPISGGPAGLQSPATTLS